MRGDGLCAGDESRYRARSRDHDGAHLLLFQEQGGFAEGSSGGTFAVPGDGAGSTGFAGSTAGGVLAAPDYTRVLSCVKRAILMYHPCVPAAYLSWLELCCCGLAVLFL